jgi:hypothetical protein
MSGGHPQRGAALASRRLANIPGGELVLRRGEHLQALEQVGRNRQPVLLSTAAAGGAHALQQAELEQARLDGLYRLDAALQVDGHRRVAWAHLSSLVIGVRGVRQRDGLDCDGGQATAGRPPVPSSAPSAGD